MQYPDKEGKGFEGKSGFESCDPNVGEFVEEGDLGKQARVEINTGRAPDEVVDGVIVEEGPVEMILLEPLGSEEAGALLRGVAKFAQPNTGQFGKGRRLVIHIDKRGLLPTSAMYFPTCMMVTQGGWWGLPVFTDTSTGQLYILPTAHVELVQSFDERKPPRTGTPTRK